MGDVYGARRVLPREAAHRQVDPDRLAGLEKGVPAFGLPTNVTRVGRSCPPIEAAPIAWSTVATVISPLSANACW